MSRNLRTTIPATQEYLQPATVDRETVQRRDEALKDRQELNFNARHAVRNAAPLAANAKVYLPDRKEEGIIMQQANVTRSYIVQTDSGEYRRNRSHICPLPTPPDSETPVQLPSEPVQDSAPIPEDTTSPPSPASPAIPADSTPPASPELVEAATQVQASDESEYRTRSGRRVKPPKR